MTPSPWGTDVPPSWAEIPRHVPGVDRVSRYLLRPELAVVGHDSPAWLSSGRELDGFRPHPDVDEVVLLEPGGDDRVRVPASWVELVAGSWKEGHVGATEGQR
ncbi:MAG: hypothetical protein SFU84_05290 [Gemmatimonadales bacterium]|nr:hypothetical protein [Gemmatimonadales bacterium]